MKDRTENDQVVIEILQQESHEKDKEEAQATNRIAVQPFATGRNLLRHFRLQILPILAACVPSWKTGREPRKVAIYRSRWIATISSLLHFLPMSGAIVLLTLQWTSYFVSLQDDDSTTLQFVAKLHELLMQTSIVEIVICIIRTESVNGFVPLGILSGIDRATQLSYLWSPDFWSALQASLLRGWRRVLLLVSIFVLVLLTPLLGPSSAILMIPRPSSPHILRTDTLYNLRSTEAMYPSVIGAGNELDLNVSNINALGSIPLDDNYVSLKTWALEARHVSMMNDDTSLEININNAQSPPNTTGINSRVVRTSSQRFRKVRGGREVEGDYNDIYGMQVKITLPTVYSAISLQTVTNNMLTKNGTQSRANKTSLAPLNGTVMVQMPLPVVVTECVETTIPLHPDSTITYVVHDQGRYGRTLANLSTLGALAKTASASTYRFREVRYHAPVWEHSSLAGSPLLIGVFITDKLPSNDSDTLSQILDSKQNGSVVAMACTIGASWESGQIHLRPVWSDEAVMPSSYPKSRSRNTRDISLNVTGIDAVSSAHFHWDMITTSSKWAAFDSFSSNWGRATFPLCAMFALGLSKVPEVTAMYLDQKGWSDSYYVKDLVWRLPPQVHPADTTKVKFSVIKYGYGYGTRTTSIYLAMTVLLTYCIITFMYITYTIATGSASTAWNSGIELVILALQSRKPRHLGHASVGIDSIKTFSESVGFRVNSDDELELVFANDRDFATRRLRKIERNKEY